MLSYAERAISYSVGATRVETRRGPLDLIFLFGRDFATFEQVRNKVGHCRSLGLQKQDQNTKNDLTGPKTSLKGKGAPSGRAQTRKTCPSGRIAIAATRARSCGSHHLGTIRGCSGG